MKILAADTSTPVITAALWRDDRVAAETFVLCGRRHAELLLDTVEWVLTQAACSLDDVDALAVTRGPGSFTGLRVGIAAFKGLALARNLPLVGVPTLDALARTHPLHDGPVCTLLDAKMNEVFAARYRYTNGCRERLTDDAACPIEEAVSGLEPGTLFIGDGAILYRDAISALAPGARFSPPELTSPRAGCVAAEAAAMLERRAETDAGRVEPVYLRKSQAELNAELQ